MREILFRGQTRKLGEKINPATGEKLPGNWVYGGVLQGESSHSIIYGTDNLDFPGVVNRFAVHTDTLGQYTGLTDKNGKRIFEGDILQVKGYGEVTDRCVVECGIYAPFNHSSKSVGFYLCWKHDKEQLQKYANLAYWVEEREAVCIGNIHDNPELIAEVEG